MGYIVIFNRLTGFPNVAQLVHPMVHVGSHSSVAIMHVAASSNKKAAVIRRQLY